MVFYLSYFFLALPASWLLRRTGMKKGMALGLLVMAAGALVFGEFVVRRWYPGALDRPVRDRRRTLAAADRGESVHQHPRPDRKRGAAHRVHGHLQQDRGHPRAARDRRAGHARPRRSQGAGAGGRSRDARALLDAFAARIHVPYLVMAGDARRARHLDREIAAARSPRRRRQSQRDDGTRRARSIFAFPHLWLGVLCLFVYVGVEVMAGDAIGTYGRGFGLPADETKFFTSFTLTAMLVGYVVGLLTIPRFISQARYLALSAVLGIVLSLGAYVTHGYVSVAFVAALGFANAMMWPAIFPLAIAGLGRLTETGSALLIMGIAGGAMIPQTFALLREHHDFQLVFVAIMVPCYAYILFYALRGHRVGMRTRMSVPASAPYPLSRCGRGLG